MDVCMCECVPVAFYRFTTSICNFKCTFRIMKPYIVYVCMCMCVKCQRCMSLKKTSFQSINFIHFILCTLKISIVENGNFECTLSPLLLELNGKAQESARGLDNWTHTQRARKRAKNDLLQLKRCDSFVNHSSKSILKMDQWRWKIRRSLIQICRKELKVSSPPPLPPLPHIAITCYILFACLWVRDPFNILLLLEMIFFLTQLSLIRKRIETEKQKKNI